MANTGYMKVEEPKYRYWVVFTVNGWFASKAGDVELPYELNSAANIRAAAQWLEADEWPEGSVTVLDWKRLD